jgi:gluconolactonase
VSEPPSAAPPPTPAAFVSSAPPAAPRELPDFCEGASTDVPVSNPAHAALIKDGFGFVEGPVWSESLGSFLFSEMDFNGPGTNGPPSKINQLTLPSATQVFIGESGSNGLAIDEHGLVACTHDTQTISRFDLETHQRTVLVSDFEGKHFNSPNDVTVHSAGHIYFTDPDWQLGQRKNETGITGVYWRNPAGEVRLIEAGLSQPNGITLSPDETKLYVGAVSGEISVYPVLADGSVGARQHFAYVEQPDGMAVDCAGRLFVASHAAGEVIVLSPEGSPLATIHVAPRTTNVAFGGPERRTLFITAGSGVFTLRTGTPGFPY